MTPADIARRQWFALDLARSVVIDVERQVKDTGYIEALPQLERIVADMTALIESYKTAFSFEGE